MSMLAVMGNPLMVSSRELLQWNSILQGDAARLGIDWPDACTQLHVDL